MRDHMLPQWCVVEGYHDFNHIDWRFRVALRCLDADVLVLDIPAYTVSAAGRSDRLQLKRRQLLELLIEQLTVQLATATLEET
jgi:hypothetical protein